MTILGYGLKQDIENAGVLGNMALNPESLVQDRYNAPSEWGNNDLLSNYLQQYTDFSPDRIHGLDPQTVVFYTGSTIVYSLNQWNYWTGIIPGMED